MITKLRENVNPCTSGVPARDYVPQAGGDLVTRPTPSPDRHDVLAAEKLAARTFRPVKRRPGAWTVEGGSDTYIIVCVERLGEMTPTSCSCPSRKPCSHLDALAKALAYRPDHGELHCVSPAPAVSCRMCGGPCVNIVQFGEIVWANTMCVGRVMGSGCNWRIY